MNKDVVIIGAGAAGIGMAAIIDSLGIDVGILDREGIGSSFKKWPKEMRFISPSFTGNFFGHVDLNAITPNTSPAFTLKKEHPSGDEYANYLERVAQHFELDVEVGYDVKSISKDGDDFLIKTSKGDVKAKYVIWAAGEFQYPNLTAFEGSEHCMHNTSVDTWKNIEGEEFIVIGGYESGMDAAIQLSKLGKKVTILDSDDQLGESKSDSSYSLSPYTREQYLANKKNITIQNDTVVVSVTKDEDGYEIKTENETLFSKTKPIMGVGFDTSLVLVEDHFTFADGSPLLSENDESTVTPNLFLAGPQVKHGNAIFCFVYKYRQRFAVVAEEIANRLGIDPEHIKEMVDYHKENKFYLKDTSCCDHECEC